MFKNMKLGQKIGAGFAALIVIALALGGLAVWNMRSVQTTATELSAEKVPQVQLATGVERTSLLTMYAARGYNYTEEKQFLDDAMKELAAVKKALSECKDHANKYNIAILKENEAKASTKLAEYEGLLNETVAKTEAMAKDKAASLVAGDKYMKVCNAYVTRKSKDQEKAISVANDEKSKAQLTQLTKEITIVNEIIDLGNWIRTGTWQAIATRDPKLFQETEKKFDDVNKKLDEIKAGTTDAQDLKEVEECRVAGKEYLDCMTSFLTNWLAREEIGKKRVEVAAAVLTAAKETSTAGGDEVAKSASAV